MQYLTPLLRQLERLSFTPAERGMVYAYVTVAGFGAALGLNVVLTLGGVAAAIAPFSTYDYWVILSSAVGACAGLYLGRDRLGNEGKRGLMQAAFGMIWVSFVGALIGGTLALPFYGTMFGPFTLIMSLINAPVLALLWACSLISAHIMIKQRRVERDSILFVELPQNSSNYF